MFAFLNKEKRYFKAKMVGVQNMIWDLEFKRYKTLEIREERRQTYDNARSQLAILEQQIKAAEPTKKEKIDEFKRLEDKQVLLKRDIERLLEQMKALDLEVAGSVPTAQYPEGVTGVTQQIDALRELKTMLRDYIKTL